MPYYHIDCGGKISIFTRRCKKCGNKWPKEVWLARVPPPDMEFISPIKFNPMGRHTNYAKWAKGTPAELLASRLPNWPRWIRISFLLLVLLVIVLVIKLVAC